MSKTRAREMASYARIRKLFLDAALFCVACEARELPRIQRPVEVHHTRGKIGRLLNMVEHWLPVCAECHRWITDHTTKARELGLIAPVGKWNSVK